MRLKEKSLSFIINFLLGVAWAFMLIGAVSSFLSSYYHDGILAAFVSAFIGMLPGMFAVLVLEYIITGKEQYYELKKQTALLEKILMQKDNGN
jgi:uncharacterized membrane protein YjjB (DUF3815 family)